MQVLSLEFPNDFHVVTEQLASTFLNAFPSKGARGERVELAVHAGLVGGPAAVVVRVVNRGDGDLHVLSPLLLLNPPRVYHNRWKKQMVFVISFVCPVAACAAACGRGLNRAWLSYLRFCRMRHKAEEAPCGASC